MYCRENPLGMALPTRANHSDIISLVISLVKYEPSGYNNSGDFKGDFDKMMTEGR